MQIDWMVLVTSKHEMVDEMVHLLRLLGQRIEDFQVTLERLLMVTAAAGLHIQPLAVDLEWVAGHKQ